MSKQKDLGRSLEHRVANRAKEKGLDAERHWGSGMNPEKPSDGRIESILFEAKVRTASVNARGEKSLTIPLDALRKVQRQASELGYEQGIMVANAKGDSHPLVICDMAWLLELLVTVKASKSSVHTETTVSD
jgi:hypothetical protein